MQESLHKEIDEKQSGKKNVNWGKLGKDSNGQSKCKEENDGPKINRCREASRHRKRIKSSRMKEDDWAKKR